MLFGSLSFRYSLLIINESIEGGVTMRTWNDFVGDVMSLEPNTQKTYPVLIGNDVSLLHYFRDPIVGAIVQPIAEIISDDTLNKGTFTIKRL
jgi:hypothetical protein